MSINRILISVAVVLLFSACTGESDDRSPANVILLIGDGMDEQQITMARNYIYGIDGSFEMEKFGYRGAAKVRAVREDNPAIAEYVGDSASGATALATGMLTSKGRIATTAGTDRDIETIVEISQHAGLATALVTTASLTDATPAAFIAHVNARSCQGPDDMAGGSGRLSYMLPCLNDLKRNGGRGSIAEQLVDSNIDLMFGAGMKYFSQAVDSDRGLTVVDSANAQGYRVITKLAELTAPVGKGKVLGLFGPSTLATEWLGENGRTAEPIKPDKQGDPIFPQAFSCVPNSKHEGVPSLALMTKKALTLLNENNSKGFFLMVEGASIDRQAHFRNPCGEIGEVQGFDRAVAVAQAFAQAHPHTLVIVTADHGQAGQIVPLPETYRSLATFYGKPQYSLGFYALLTTQEGGVMAVNYATNSASASSRGVHTGVDVPVFIDGLQAGGLPGLIRQTDIFRLMLDHLGLQDHSN